MYARLDHRMPNNYEAALISPQPFQVNQGTYFLRMYMLNVIRFIYDVYRCIIYYMG